MTLITLKHISHGYGGPALLDRLDFSIERGERICLLGRNGSGKSTLIKLINDELCADDGEIARRKSLNSQRLSQEVPANLSGSVYDITATGLGDLSRLIKDWHHATVCMEETPGNQQRIEDRLADLSNGA